MFYGPYKILTFAFSNFSKFLVLENESYYNQLCFRVTLEGDYNEGKAACLADYGAELAMPLTPRMYLDLDEYADSVLSA